MSLIRAAVGLLLLVLAFAFKAGDIPLWFVGAAGAMAQAGVLAGAALAPRLRKRCRVEDHRRIARRSPAWAASSAGSSAVWSPPRCCRSSSGPLRERPSRPSTRSVQKDAPDANRGRSFARFETRFQLAWVMGAFIPVVLSGVGIPITVEVGYVLIGLLMAIGLVSYWVGQRRVAAGTYDWESPSQKLIRLGLRRGDPAATAAAVELGMDPTAGYAEPAVRADPAPGRSCTGRAHPAHRVVRRRRRPRLPRRRRPPSRVGNVARRPEVRDAGRRGAGGDRPHEQLLDRVRPHRQRHLQRHEPVRRQRPPRRGRST